MTSVRKTSQEKTRMANQGEGLSCGISLGVGGSHQCLA